MYDFLINTLASATAGGALIALLAWISKSWISERLKADIQHIYNQKLESHKNELQAQSALSMERMRSQLSIAATERQVQFAGLHQKRSTVIAAAYDLLVTAHRECASFTSYIVVSGGRPLSESHWNGLSAVQKFARYIDSNRVYFPAALCKPLEHLSGRMLVEMHAPMTLVRYADDNLPVHVAQQREEAIDRVRQYFDQEFPSARAALEHEFRKLLGDHTLD